MSCNHFDNIWYAVRWSRQPPKQPAGMSLEQYHWMLIDDFVASIVNRHRLSMFMPGNEVKANKTVICWCGDGGVYMNKGLPMYLALERKERQDPESDQHLVDDHDAPQNCQVHQRGEGDCR